MKVLPLLILAACSGGTVKLDDTAGKDTDTDTQDTDTGDTGPVVAEGFTVSPAALDLGIVFLGSSASDTLTVTNTGDTDLALQLSVSGVFASAYGVNVDVANPAPGQSATVNVLLAPTNWGDHAAELTVTDAGGDSVVIPIAALVQVDSDGDGYGSEKTGGDDCVDTDATINPEAGETWYDGIDSDCAGDDDFDQDHDGVTVETDCVDTDSTVYPGADDAWYDGVDSDCLGNSDYDQDGDGYDASDYGGLDCADEDPARNPSAGESWYDGVDTDCSGGSDYDQDGDGHDSDEYGGDDCDDLVATTYPGAPETWYDGVDSDCLLDNDYDQDGDGVEYPTDCNDTDPTVTGPEPESWDGVDNDCSGYVDDFPVTDAASGVLYGDPSDAVGGNNTLALGGDADADGGDDLVVTTSSRSSYGIGWVVQGADVLTGGALDSVALATITGGYSSSTDADYFPVGVVNAPMRDVTGDGRADPFVGGGYVRYSSYYYGSFALVDGADLTGNVSLPSGAQANFYGDSTSADYVKQGATGDLDGDGTPDLVVAGPYDNYTTGSPDTDASGVLGIFLGNAWSGYHDFRDADQQINGEDDNDYLGWSLVAADVDGDGTDDIVAGAPGYNASVGNNAGAVYVIPGDTTGAWADDVVTGIYRLRIAGGSRDQGLGSDAIPSPGDFDGDGAADLALADGTAASAWIFLASSGLSGDLTVSDADVTVAGSSGFGTSAAAVDFDGDGADELAVGASGDDNAGIDAGAVYLFGGAWSASMSPSGASGVLWGASAGDALGAGLGGGVDLDGDGKEELVVGATGQDGGGTNSGAVYAVLGR